jgi:hypothetical protein
MKEYIVTIVGYKGGGNTTCYPFVRFMEVFKHLGYRAEWKMPEELTDANPRILICWNEPTIKDLYEQGKIKPEDIPIQKVTCLGKGDASVDWGNDALGFFKSWDKWTLYRLVEEMYDKGLNIYAFGCRTNTEMFPEKHRMYKKVEDRFFFVPWGSSLYSYDEVMNCKPVMSGFTHDIGYVGSKWGKAGRGNIDSWNHYMEPLVAGKTANLRGMGFPNGPANDEEHKKVLKSGRICPIISAPSWRVQKGIQDRFWTVFTSGRFGVVDNEGAYSFFNEEDIICETDPEAFIDTSNYFLKNVEKQLPYIERVQKRIKEEYNWYHTWDNILKTVIKREKKW